MLRRLRGALVVLALLLLLAPAAAALEPPADDSDPWYVTAGNVGASVFDVVLLRPLGFLATVGGFVCFTAALPFTAVQRDFSTPWDIFVLGPADYTFLRPLGDF
jgi:hypothetical protein